MKALNLLKKNKKDKNSQETSKKNILFEKTPYKFSDYYTYHAGKVSTVFRLYIRPGSNRGLTFMNVLNLVPNAMEDDLEVVFSVSDRVTTDKKKQSVIKENAKKNKNTILENASDKKNQDNTEDKKQIRQIEFEDYGRYERIIATNEPIVSYEIKMMVIGKEVEHIEDFIETLNISLKKKYDGLQWDNLTGETKEDFDNFLGIYKENKNVLSSTAANYSILNFNMSSGLNDVNGVPIGRDALSFFGATSFFDFNNSLNKRAIISMPKNSRMTNYIREEQKTAPKSSSLIAQALANNVVMNGSRVFHIVLNDFDYSESGLFYRPTETFSRNIFEKNDVSKITINPMQGYGDVKDVVNVFSRVKNKIVDMFDILQDFNLSKDDKAVILDALNTFYVNNKLWNYNAADKPETTHIVNIKRPETYVTMGRFISGFTSLLSEAKLEKRELKTDRIETLRTMLDDALTSYERVLGRPSTIKKSDSLQTYYDFHKISDKKIKQIQLLNLLDFIIYNANKDDVIIFHGLDVIDSRVLYMIHDIINDASENKGIRFVYGFDVISNDKYNNMKNLDMFDLKGAIYRDLYSDVDFSIIGRCLENEVRKYEEALTLALSRTIKTNMMAVSNSMALIHRRIGNINNFTNMQVII